MEFAAQSTRWIIIGTLAAVRFGAALLSARRLDRDRRAAHLTRQLIELPPALIFAGLGALAAFGMHIWSRLSGSERVPLGVYPTLFAVGYVAESLLAQHVAQEPQVRARTWALYGIVGLSLLMVAVYVIPPQ